MNEVKKRKGRPRTNFHTPILSAEQVQVIRGDAPQTVETAEQAAERRERDRIRQADRRAQEKLAKQMGVVETKEELWKLNRSQLPAEELSALLAIQSRVFDIVHWCNETMAGTCPEDDEDFVSVENGTAGLKNFVKERGITTIEISLLGQYWKNVDLHQRFQGTDPDSIFARLGLVVGFPSHKLHQFEEWLGRTTTPTATAAATLPYTTMTCSSEGCNTPPVAMQTEIAERYAELKIKYFCHRCQALEQKARAESTIVQRGALSLYRGVAQ